jgi:hypothetical protein
MIQVPGKGRLLPAEVLQQELARHAVFHRLMAHYAHAFTVQVMQSAACNALHPVEQRACKWMLMTQDRVYTNEFKLTHEFLGMMLGVSAPLSPLSPENCSKKGLITYRHGQVTVRSRRVCSG